MKNTGAIMLAMLLILTLLSATAIIPSPAGAENDPAQPPEGGTVYFSGPWNITDTREYRNCTIIADGNITVKSGGNLILRNVTLKMNCSSDKQWKIDVWNGGEMHILDWDNDNTTTGDASNISVNDTSSTFLFLVRDGASFEMRNSEIHQCGTGLWVLDPPAPNPAYWGLYIETDNATIDHNLISKNTYGIVLYGSDAKISNNTITWNDARGIYAGYWSNGTIENNWITWNYDYGIYVTGGGSSNTKPSNPKIIRNVITDTGRGVNTADGIQVLYGSKPLIKDTVILRSKEDGLYSDGSTPTLINVTIDAEGVGNYGIVGSSTRDIYIINSTIKNSKRYDLSANSASYFVVINSTFNTTECYIDGANITVKWYLHVYVEDSNNMGIPSANVRIKDNENGTYDRNFTTDSNGYVRWIVLTEYVSENVSGKYTNTTYYTPYNISVNYSGLTFTNNPRNSTINESKTEVFRATTPVPEFPSVLVPVLFVVVIAFFFGKRKSRAGRK